MPSWTNATPAATPGGVILHRHSFDRTVTRLLAAPGPELSDVVETFWAVTWNLPQMLVGSLVPQFSVNLTFEENSGRPGSEAQVVVTGVPGRRFDVDLLSTGHVVGVKFRPGAFTAVSGVPASTLADRTVPADYLLPESLVSAFRLAAGEAASVGDDVQPADITRALLPHLPGTVSADCRLAQTVLDDARDSRVTRVDQLAARHSLGVRALQRLFDRWIGLSPKKVVTRCRLHDAVVRLDGDAGVSMADTALELGFYDQSHFTREFTSFVGVSPARYVAGDRAGTALE